MCGGFWPKRLCCCNFWRVPIPAAAAVMKLVVTSENPSKAATRLRIPSFLSVQEYRASNNVFKIYFLDVFVRGKKRQKTGIYLTVNKDTNVQRPEAKHPLEQGLKEKIMASHCPCHLPAFLCGAEERLEQLHRGLPSSSGPS